MVIQYCVHINNAPRTLCIHTILMTIYHMHDMLGSYNIIHNYAKWPYYFRRIATSMKWQRQVRLPFILLSTRATLGLSRGWLDLEATSTYKTMMGTLHSTLLYQQTPLMPCRLKHLSSIKYYSPFDSLEFLYNIALSPSLREGLGTRLYNILYRNTIFYQENNTE